MRKLFLTILPTLCLLYTSGLYAQDTPQHLNPLSLLSEYNLQRVGHLATPDEAGKAWGALFQFGRNIPFDYTGEAPREAITVSSNDPNVWSESFLTKSESATTYDWLSTGTLGDNWVDIVSQAVDAPASYRGDNGGDPCPRGMHIPSYSEWTAILPSSFSVADFTGKIGIKQATETITIQSVTKEYRADYYSKKKNEIIGIKCSDTEGRYRTAFRWSWADYGLLIEAKWIGQRYATIEELVAETNFWTTDDDAIVRRFLPASGHISGSTGLAGQRYEDLYYWSATASKVKEGFAPTAWGFPYGEEFGEGGIAIYENVMGRYSAACIRCMMEEPSTVGTLPPSRPAMTLRVTKDGDGILSLAVTPDLVGVSYNLYTMEGTLIERGIISETQQWLNVAHLPHDYYILAVGKQTIKVER